MKKYLLLVLFALTVTACAEERTVVHDNSAASKFSSLFNSDNRWQLSDGEAKPAAMDKDGRPVILKDAPGNFSGYHIVTSFQTDEPASPGQPGQPDGGTNGPGFPTADPWMVPSTRPTPHP